jgi:general secretion pathway protein C
VDRFRYFHFSLSDLQGLVSRRMVILALMAVLLYQGVGIFYKLLTIQIIRMRPAPAAAIMTPAAASAVREPADAYQVIRERNLFGTTKAVAEKQKEKQGGDAQKDIALLIDLRGTVAGESQYGFAIVEEKKTRKQSLVKTGDVLAGAKVVRINRNSIDLLVEDQEQTLKMAESNEAPILSSSPTETAAAEEPPVPDDALMLNRSEIEAEFQDMGSMLRQAQIRPYFNAGSPEGFMITNIRSGSLYQKMGIKNGDIIQGLNGNAIRTADDMVKLYNLVKSSPSLALSIKRRGKAETLNYQFQ